MIGGKYLTFIGLFLVFLVAEIFPAGQQEEQTPNAETDSSFNETGYPIVNEKVSFTIFSAKHNLTKKPYNELMMYKKIEEKTNVHIEWIEAQGTQLTEKKNLLFASGDLPDAFIAGLTSDEEYRYGAQGLLLPLEGLIEEWAPNVEEFLSKRPMVRKVSTTPDGHTYGIPTVIELGNNFGEVHMAEKLFTNKTWIEKLGYELPGTIPEFEEVLRAIRDGDPNGNGRKDEIPLSFRFGQGSDSGYSLFGLFGRLDNNTHILLENGKVVFTANTPEHRDALEWLHTLYAEGLIDQEIFTQSSAQFMAKGKNVDLLYGMFFSHNGFNIVGQDIETAQYVALPPLKNVNGEYMWRSTPWNSIHKSRFNITSAAWNRNVLMRWVDTLYEPMMSTELYFGPMDVNIAEAEDGTLSFIPTPDGMSYGEFRHSESPGATSTGSILSEVFARFDDSAIEKWYYTPLWDTYKVGMKPETDYPPVYFREDDLQRLISLKNDIEQYVLKMQAQFITKGNINAEWDDYVGQLSKMGLTDLLAIYQRAYDDFMSSGS